MNAVRERLNALSDDKFKRFSCALLPNAENVLGVRLPELRQIAKEGALKNWKAFFDSLSDDTFEERMLQGMVLGYAKVPFEEIEPYIEKFLPKIDNWSVCDAFCCGIKSIRKSPEAGWKTIRRLSADKREFYARVGIVTAMDHFINETYLNDVFETVQTARGEGYYVRMAQGWAVSVCAAKFPEETYAFLKTAELPPQAFQKSVQKIRESRRISPADKRRFSELTQRRQAKI